MKYISLFSGIGGFEIAIHRVFPDAECLGYSEIKKSAIKVYEKHFPSHHNLGDITKITVEDIKHITKNGCDLVVGGFPCTNLSSLACFNKENSGLDGKKSGLFYELLRLLQIVKPKHIIIENNNSMSKTNKEIITGKLREIFIDVNYTKIDSSLFGVQTRKRLYWTTFCINNDYTCTQTWNDILEPLNNVNDYIVSPKIIEYNNCFFPRKATEKQALRVVPVNNTYYKFQLEEKTDKRTRWDVSMVSDTTSKIDLIYYPLGKSRTIIATSGNNNILIDRRTGQQRFLVRYFSPVEKERLFNFPDDWTYILKYKTTRGEVLGNSVVVNVIIHILNSLPK